MGYETIPGEFLQVEFLCHDQTPLVLEYELFETPVTRRWLELLRKDLQLPERTIASQLNIDAQGSGCITVVREPATQVPMSQEDLALITSARQYGWLYLGGGNLGGSVTTTVRAKTELSAAPPLALTSELWLSFDQTPTSLGQMPLGKIANFSFDRLREIQPRLIEVLDIRIRSLQAGQDELETEQILSKTRELLDEVSPTFCPVKWKHSTINFATASAKSCCHQAFRKIERSALDGEGHLHDTPTDRIERELMLTGARPSNCSSCFTVEDQGHFSNRHIWSSKAWLKPFFDEVRNARTRDALNPSWLELNFSSACQLKCSYCSPIFSTKWAQEIEAHGPYPTRVPHNDSKYLSGMPSVEDPETSELMQAFWPWLEKIYSGLRLMKVTGGEPLLANSTFRLMEYIAQHPHNLLTLSVNTNLSVPAENFARFMTLINKMEKADSVFRFFLHPSLDSWGKRAEYIRFGLNMDTFKRNLEYYLDRSRGSVFIICTLNNLSLGGLLDLWRYVLDLKKAYGRPRRPISITTEILHGPLWQNLAILPHSFQSHLEEVIAFLKANMAFEGKGFEEHEVRGLERALSMTRQPMEESIKQGAREDFYRFFTEHDRRRGTNFVETFPELAEFYRSCQPAELE